MSAVSLMEWNPKQPAQWDWDNLIAFNSKKLHQLDWEPYGDKGLESGSFFSANGGNGCGSPGSGSGFDSLSRSSKSGSICSSSPLKEKISPEEVTNKNGFTEEMPGNSTPEVSVGSTEPLLGLKLGKRTYFKDVYAGSGAKITDFSPSREPSITFSKRPKANAQQLHGPRCQVEGCNLDLSSAKDYHRKHRVCETHSKCPKVIVAGLERRFCQQCSRFHGLLEFDEKKRSCRKRLSDHNARRRKPQPESVHLNSGRLSSFYDEKQQMNLLWNTSSFDHAKPIGNAMWDGNAPNRLSASKDYMEGTREQLRIPGCVSGSIPIHPPFSSELLPLKDKECSSEVLGSQGLDDSVLSNNAINVNHDLCRAPSLLSSSSWSSCGPPKPASLEQVMHANHMGMSQSELLLVPHSFPANSPELWRNEPQHPYPRPHNLNPGSMYLQEMHLLRDPFDDELYHARLS